MRTAGRLLNKAEEVAFRELDTIAKDNGFRLFSKPRLSDLIVKNTKLSAEDFNFYTRAHVDFAVTDQQTKPLFVVEYDGPFHASPIQQRRDRVKDHLCAEASLGLLRINANHVTRLFRGMSLVRWIIEVAELEKWFDAAQRSGHLPWDEPFDPAMIMSDGKGKSWPYWLSIEATKSINDFVFQGTDLDQSGWAGFIGTDADNHLYDLSYCWKDDRVIWSKTAVKRQNFRFPAYDLLREISVCELNLKIQESCAGTHVTTSAIEFRPILERFCSRYDARPSHSCGGPGPISF